MHSKAFDSCLNQNMIARFGELSRIEVWLGKSCKVTVQAEVLVHSLVKAEKKLVKVFSINFAVGCVGL